MKPLFALILVTECLLATASLSYANSANSMSSAEASMLVNKMGGGYDAEDKVLRQAACPSAGVSFYNAWALGKKADAMTLAAAAAFQASDAGGGGQTAGPFRDKHIAASQKQYDVAKSFLNAGHKALSCAQNGSRFSKLADLYFASFSFGQAGQHFCASNGEDASRVHTDARELSADADSSQSQADTDLLGSDDVPAFLQTFIRTTESSRASGCP